MFVTDSGTAIPAANTINVFGGTGIHTSGSGDTILITSTAVVTLDGNTGAATASGNIINVVGTGSLTSNGSGSTLTFSLTGLNNHAVLVGAGTATVTNVGPTATAGQVLQSAGFSSDPVFSTATYPATTTINDILYSSSANVVGQITASSNGVLISGTTGIPSWLAAGTTGQVLVATTSNPASWGTLSSIAVTSITATAPLTANGASGSAQTGAVTVALTTPLALTYGGTNASLVASNGGIFYSTATAGAILSGTATANQALLSGASSAPAWSTATYPPTTTINQILYSSSNNVIAGITSAANGVLISSNSNVPSFLANSGTPGFVLTANAGAPPSWQSAAAGGITTIDGDSGSITGTTVKIYANNAGNACGSSVLFSNSGTTSTLQVTDGSNNTFIGLSAGNLSGGSGGSNCGFGNNALTSLTTGTLNSALGVSSMFSLLNGSHNTAQGVSSLDQITSGGYNTAVGYHAGYAYTSSESSNICIGNVGTTSESNVIRIGTQGSGSGQQNICYIAGITGATPTSGNTPQVVLCDNTGNLAPISSSTAGYVLTSNGSATPSFQAVTGAPPVSVVAYLSGNLTNTSGDGTDYTIVCDSTTVNTGTMYNTSTGVTTVPTTGTYQFNATVLLTNIAAASTYGYFRMVQVSTGYEFLFVNFDTFPQAAGGNWGFTGSAAIYLAAGDGVYFTYTIAGGAKQITVRGGTGQYFTSITGFLVH